MKAIILARVSTEEQREINNSIPAQIERMESYCARKELEIIEQFSFDESAYGTRRDEFDKVLEKIQESKERFAICFDKVDRFSRNVFDRRVGILYDLAMQGKIELHFTSDNLVITPDISAAEKFHFGISLGAAKYYSDAISDSVKRTFEHKRREGKWTGPAPIGYKNIPLDEEKRLRKDIVPDPERAYLIQELFRLYATANYSITRLWQKTTEMGLRNKDEKPLSRSNIQIILKNPFYYGVAYSKKYGHYPHGYQPLITKEFFDKCQEVMRGRSNRPSKMTLNEYMFQGLLPCANCGCLYSPEHHKGNNYYSCTNAKGICKRVYVNEKELLEPIHEVFETFESIPREVQEQLVEELRELNETEAGFHQSEINRIRAEYDRTQAKINKLLDLRLEERITSDDYDKKLEELKDNQYRLGVELEEYTKADHQYYIHVSIVLNLSRRIREIFESSETLEKRAILNYLLQNPTVSGKKLEFTLRKPFDTVLELAGCPNWLRGWDSNPQPKD